jgi:hypothetical protein
MKSFVTLVIGALLMLSGASVNTAAAQAPARQSVAGDWDASYATPGGSTAFKITFVVAAEKLSGTVHRASGELPLSGVVKGDSVSFIFTIQYNDHPLIMTINAKVTGDSMAGTVDFGGQGGDSFEAKRAPSDFLAAGSRVREISGSFQ